MQHNYKLYKSGKNWVYASSLMLVGLGSVFLLNTPIVSADTTTLDTTDAVNTSSTETSSAAVNAPLILGSAVEQDSSVATDATTSNVGQGVSGSSSIGSSNNDSTTAASSSITSSGSAADSSNGASTASSASSETIVNLASASESAGSSSFAEEVASTVASGLAEQAQLSAAATSDTEFASDEMLVVQSARADEVVNQSNASVDEALAINALSLANLATVRANSEALAAENFVIDPNVATVADLETAINAAPTNGTLYQITITAPITGTGGNSLTLPVGSNIEIDGDGTTNTQMSNMGIIYGSGATLTLNNLIIDESAGASNTLVQGANVLNLEGSTKLIGPVPQNPTSILNWVNSGGYYPIAVQGVPVINMSDSAEIIGFGSAVYEATGQIINMTGSSSLVGNAFGIFGVTSTTITLASTASINNNAIGFLQQAGAFELTGGTFSNNIWVAGYLVDTDNSTIDQATFSDNSGMIGTPIEATMTEGQTLTISNSTFINNVDNATAGAVAISSGNLDVTNSTFTGNSSLGNGGAITIVPVNQDNTINTLSVTGTHFTNNIAYGQTILLPSTTGTILINGIDTGIQVTAVPGLAVQTSGGSSTITGATLTTSADNILLVNGVSTGVLATLSGGGGAIGFRTYDPSNLYLNGSGAVYPMFNTAGANGNAYLPQVTVDSTTTFANNIANALYTVTPSDLAANPQIAATTESATSSPINNYDIQYYSANVIFNSNGGTTVPNESTQDGGLVVQPTNPSNGNWNFAGWYSDATLTTPWDFSSSVMPTGLPGDTLTLYAGWQTNVTYDANGGTGVPTDTANYAPNATVIVPTTVPTKTGYDFTGWLLPDGSTVVQPGGSFTATTANPVLTAQWTATPATVTFNSNGGTAVADEATHDGALVTQPTDPTNGSWAFTGWYSDAGLTTPWNFTSDTVPAGLANNTLALYAGWQTNVTYDANGGTGAPTDTTNYAPNAMVTVPTTVPAKTGYDFTGWLLPDGSTVVQPGGSFTATTANPVLTAQWTATPATVTFNSNGGTAVADEATHDGALVTQPAAPTNGSWAFTGWYSDAGLTTPWNFTSDMVPAGLANN
ncbi:hypothetical protein ESZ50_11435, partial [Weissella muntiaci]